VSALIQFILESNRIEGIERAPESFELDAHRRLLACDFLSMKSIEDFVFDICGKQLRRDVGMDVRVGPHTPIRGGRDVEEELGRLLTEINERSLSAYAAHVAYEILHPFMDGNGRSGRCIWAWMMQREGSDPFSLPFLHRFYYQALDAGRQP
jgi:hypothetical protein